MQMGNDRQNLAFSIETDCFYKEERYSVRDNGSLFRYQRGSRFRPLDNQWLFGKLNEKSGYLEIASVPVHRIVASAYHGMAPTREHVVDHIDTNRQNNRPTNLRWVTRLENILLNPITSKRIAFICGSVEAFLADPKKFQDMFHDPNYHWMCAVSAEEAKTSLERLQSWAKSDRKSAGRSLGDWIYNRGTVETPPVKQISYMMSKTPNAAQRIVTHLDKPNEFPITPQEFEGNPLMAYHRNLVLGVPFFRNHNGEYTVVKTGLSKDKNTLYVLTKSAYVWRENENGEHLPTPVIQLSNKVSDEDLPHSLTQITYEDDLFIHEKIELGFHPTYELEEIFYEYTQP